MATGDITFVRKRFTFQETDDDGTTLQAFPVPQFNVVAANFKIIDTSVHVNNQTKEGLSNATAVFIVEEV